MGAIVRYSSEFPETTPVIEVRTPNPISSSNVERIESNTDNSLQTRQNSTTSRVPLAFYEFKPTTISKFIIFAEKIVGFQIIPEDIDVYYCCAVLMRSFKVIERNLRSSPSKFTAKYNVVKIIELADKLYAEDKEKRQAEQAAWKAEEEETLQKWLADSARLREIREEPKRKPEKSEKTPLDTHRRDKLRLQAIKV